MSNYLDIISLEEARLYLRIDDTQNETDLEIISMIEGAFEYIERETNVISIPKDVTYDLDEGEMITIYDYPINSVVGADLYKKKNLYSIYKQVDPDSPAVFNVGYEDCSDYPKDLRQAVLQVLKVWYYESEKDQNGTMLPISVRQVIDKNRRFLI